MVSKAGTWIIRVINIIEIAVAVLLTMAIFALVVGMIPDIGKIITQRGGMEEFKYVMEYTSSIIIGIEFVKMVCKPTESNVVDVLMFVIARFLIIDHSSIINSLLGVIAIAILFAIKKFLFCERDDDKKEKKEKEAENSHQYFL